MFKCFGSTAHVRFVSIKSEPDRRGNSMKKQKNREPENKTNKMRSQKPENNRDEERERARAKTEERKQQRII